MMNEEIETKKEVEERRMKRYRQKKHLEWAKRNAVCELCGDQIVGDEIWSYVQYQHLCQDCCELLENGDEE